MSEPKRLGETVEVYARYRRARGARLARRRRTRCTCSDGARPGTATYRCGTSRPKRSANGSTGTTAFRAEHRTRDGRRRAPVAASTHNYYRSRLNSFFRFCIQRGLIKKDLLLEVEPLRVPTVLRQRPSPSTLNEMVRTAPNDRDRALLQTLIHTALRKSEVTAIRLGHVDLVEGWLTWTVTKSHLQDRPAFRLPVGATSTA
jgi:integrase